MTPTELRERLTKLPLADERGLARLALDVSAQADEAPRAIVEQWARGTAENGSKACLIGLELEELALAALLDEAQQGPWPRRFDLLRGAVEATVHLRDLLVLILDAHLQDATVLTPANADHPTAERVCDRTYALLARLIGIVGTSEAPLHSEADFQAMISSARDRELEAWRKARTRAAAVATARRYG
jgi:hypothetical protein